MQTIKSEWFCFLDNVLDEGNNYYTYINACLKFLIVYVHESSQQMDISEGRKAKDHLDRSVGLFTSPGNWTSGQHSYEWRGWRWAVAVEVVVVWLVSICVGSGMMDSSSLIAIVMVAVVGGGWLIWKLLLERVVFTRRSYTMGRYRKMFSIMSQQTELSSKLLGCSKL